MRIARDGFGAWNGDVGSGKDWIHARKFNYVMLIDIYQRYIMR